VRRQSSRPGARSVRKQALKAVHITAVTSRRRVRRLADNPTLALLFLVPFAVLIPGVVGRVPGYEFLWSDPGAYAYGALLADGDDETVVRATRGVAGVTFVMAMSLVVLPELDGNGHLGKRIDGLLLATTPRTIALAAICNHLLFVGRLAGPVGFAAIVAFVAGGVAPFVLISSSLALGLILMTAVAFAYPAVLAAKLGLRRVGPLYRNRRLVGTGLVLVLFASLLRLRTAFDLLADTPAGWYADVALLPATPAASGSRAGAVAAVALPLVFLSAAAAERLGGALWRCDPPSDRRSASSARRDLFSHGLVPARPVLAVVCTTWRRAHRNPGVLVFAGLLAVVTSAVTLGVAEEAPVAVPVILATYVAATVGAGPSLNPLGNEGRVLPALLTTPNGPRTLVAGYVTAGSLPGLLLASTAAVGGGAWAGRGGPVLFGLGIVGAVLGTGAPAIAVGLGVAFPKTKGATLTRAAGTYPPRLVVVGLFAVGVVSLGVPGLVADTATPWAAATLGVPEHLILVGGYAATCTLTALAATASTVFAIRRAKKSEARY